MNNFLKQVSAPEFLNYKFFSRVFFSLILCGLFFPASSFAAVAVGHATNAALTSAGTSKTWTHTVTEDNLLVVSFALNPSSSAPTGVSVTYNGTSMTVDPNVNGLSNYAGNEVLYSFYLTNPAPGNNTVSVSWTNSATLAGGSISFSGADGGIGSTATSTTALRTTFSTTNTIGSDDLLLGITEISDYQGPINWDSPATEWTEKSDNVQLSHSMGTVASSTISGTNTNAYSTYVATPILANW